MPIPCPPTALPEAFRVICLRSVRAFGRGRRVVFKFDKSNSKKCAYCTLQNEKCAPIPWYAGEEYAAFWAAMDDLVLEEEEEEGSEEMMAVKRAAYALDNVVRVTTSMMKESGTDPSVFAFSEGIRGISGKLDALRESIEALPASISGPVRGRGDGGGSGGGRRRGRRGSGAGPRERSSSPLADPDA
ncbi:hypothetical protein K469DRAFT_697782 [Zopfia rhizophila CBS 207.26]|uniref:Uncharacterized protein n=1 Tax=Zopfia rhizophila CBS 207.26 TaxID=1314779 RepID=A0A6A6EHE8_9PEZI|nr:hypothetical protein K469DRAFT_684484 [Zopfia rhizophila CBS 207.26]KAF2190525.1 hypothetical protein K469DRAFT_697782 [Zopfia rhizophila CBS 207.26]